MTKRAAIVVLASPSTETRERWRLALADRDLNFLEAGGAEQALGFLGSNEADLLLLSLDLVGAEPERLAQLDSRPAHAAPVLLSIPAAAPAALQAAAFASAAESVMVEPVEPAALAAVVRGLLRLAEARRENLELTARAAALSGKLTGAQHDVEQFASFVCHDFEEPLRGITTFVELIEEKPDRLSKQEREYLHHVISSATRVRALLRAFLSYSQAGRHPRPQVAPVALETVAASALQILRKRVEETRATVQIQGPLPAVPGDFAALQQVFEQVIGNALEYRVTDTSPSVTISSQPTEEQAWRIEIRDKGPGIPEKLRSSVFLPFKRLHGREIPGAGMGLAIARRIVEAHGGRIWLEAAAGGGTCVCFELPAAQIARQVAPGAVR